MRLTNHFRIIQLVSSGLGIYTEWFVVHFAGLYHSTSFIYQEVGLGKESLFGGQGTELGGALDSILGSMPGIDEAIAFSLLLRTVSEYRYDVVVFDTAPTGHTLKLLSFPQTLSTFFTKVGPLGSILNKVSCCCFSDLTFFGFTILFLMFLIFLSRLNRFLLQALNQNLMKKLKIHSNLSRNHQTLF